MTLVAICLVIPKHMRLSGTVTEIWRLEDNGVTTLALEVGRWSVGRSVLNITLILYTFLRYVRNV